MKTTSVGLFDGFLQVVRTTEILQGCGFSRDELSIITHTSEANEMLSNAPIKSNHTVDKQRRTLSTNLDTLMANAESLCIRGIGWVAAAGPLAFLLAKTTDETQSSDLIDSLSVFNVPDEEAEYYAEGVRRGGTLLAVTAAHHLAERAEDVILLHGAVDIRQRVLRWRQQGWHGFSPTAELYTAKEMASEWRQQAEERKPGREWNPYERNFRSHFYLTYPDCDVPYEHYAPAYRYGYQLVSNTHYDNKDWDEIETQVQQGWEKQHETAWMTVADAISYGFLTGRANSAYRSRA